MSREVMQQAFDAMSYGNTDEREAARIALRDALALVTKDVSLPEQTPVAWMHITDEGNIRMWSKSSPESIEAAIGLKPMPLYTSPPQRQPLTDEEIWQMVNDCVIGGDLHVIKYARAIEAAHGIGDKT